MPRGIPRNPRPKPYSGVEQQITDRVRALMTDRGIDQQTLAERLQLSAGYVSHVLAGNRVWTVRLMLRVAEVLECSVTDIDPALGVALKQDMLDALVLHGHQLRAVWTFIRSLPGINDPGDLTALCVVLEAFAARGRKG